MSEAPLEEQILNEHEARLLDLWTIYDSSTRILRAENMAEVYEVAVKAILTATGVDRASLLLFDEEGVMRFVAWRGLSDEYRAAVDGHSPWTPDTLDPVPILVTDARTDEGLDPYRETILNEGIRALAFVPITHQGRLIGKFMLYCDAPYDFTEHQIHLTTTVANHVAFAVVHRRNEEALRREHEAAQAERRRLRAVLDALPVGVYIADAEGKIVEYNAAGREIWRGDLPNVGPEEFHQYKAWWSGTGKEITPEAWGVTRAVREGITSMAQEITIGCFDGTRKEILNYAMPILAPNGSVEGAVAVNVDVDALKRTERALREKQRELEELNAHLELRVDERTRALRRLTENLRKANDLLQTGFEVSPYPVLVARMSNARIVAINAAGADLFGYNREELIGRSHLFLWADPAQRHDLILALRDQGVVQDAEIGIRTRSGELRIVTLSAARIEVDGTPCALTMFVDLTERKRAEEQVRALTSALVLAEERERQRLAQLLHDHLQQLLFGIQLKLVQFRKDQLDDQHRALLAQSDRLLNEALRESRTLTLELNPPILREGGLIPALDWFASQVQERHDLLLHVQGEEPAIRNHREITALLFQIIRELVFNVVKHAGTKEALVSVRQSEKAVVVIVSDEGRGFDPATIRSATGSSYGLRSIQERLHVVGGTVDFDAAPGVGTRITIRLPAVPMR